MPYPRSTFPALPLLLLPACFSPHTTDDMAGTDTADTDPGTTTADTTDTDTPTTASSTTTTDTTNPSTTDPTTTTNDTTDTDNPAPFCGDGTIDDGEECDDADQNGPGQACRADCSLNTCGDGDIGPEETCDDGSGNALELGACAPDCSRVIEAKTIRLGEEIETGNLGANPVAALDSLCNPGQKALFAFPGVREFAPLTDWPLHPYTAYYTAGDELIWVTDDTPALGIRDEQVQALEHHIYPGEALDSDAGTLTGLNPDWSTRSTNTCDGWTSSSENLLAARGNVYSTTDFLSGAPNRGCDDLTYIILLEGADTWITRVYCVEQ